MEKIYVHYGNDHYDRKAFKHIWKPDFKCNKPYGGLWGSPLDEYDSSQWYTFCMTEVFRVDRLDKRFKFKLKDGCRLAVVESLEQYEEFIEKYVISKEPPNYLWEATWRYDINYFRMMEDYDALEVLFHYDKRFKDTLWGWDVDSIVVFNPDVVIEV